MTIEATPDLQKKITVNTICSADEFTKFYYQEQKIWLKDFFRLVYEVIGSVKKYNGVTNIDKKAILVAQLATGYISIRSGC